MSAVSTAAAITEPKVKAEFVLPGRVRVAFGRMQLSTILGSCVSICLYDSHGEGGGLNHYLLPGQPGRYETEPHRWAEPAITALIEKVRAGGVPLQRLEAKIFGGAQMSGRQIPAHLRIGERNVEVALQLLARHGIPVAAKSVGGSRGRKLVFEVHTGRTWVKELRGGNF